MSHYHKTWSYKADRFIVQVSFLLCNEMLFFSLILWILCPSRWFLILCSENFWQKSSEETPFSNETRRRTSNIRIRLPSHRICLGEYYFATPTKFGFFLRYPTRTSPFGFSLSIFNAITLADIFTDSIYMNIAIPEQNESNNRNKIVSDFV